jgi:hypothetical protein
MPFQVMVFAHSKVVSIVFNVSAQPHHLKISQALRYP